MSQKLGKGHKGSEDAHECCRGVGLKVVGGIVF